MVGEKADVGAGKQQQQRAFHVRGRRSPGEIDAAIWSLGHVGAPRPQHVRDNGEIDVWVRETMESTYHPCGSCRMGEDAMAVVDGQLKVRGIEGLR